MSDIDDNDLDVTPVRDYGLSGMSLVYLYAVAYSSWIIFTRAARY